MWELSTAPQPDQIFQPIGDFLQLLGEICLSHAGKSQPCSCCSGVSLHRATETKGSDKHADERAQLAS